MSTIDLTAVKVGDRIKFAEEKPAYRVQARSPRYLICTRPYNPQRTVIYTIVDIDEQVRGPDNMVFGRGYETREDCEARLADLLDPADCTEVSHRRRIPLRVEEVRPA